MCSFLDPNFRVCLWPSQASWPGVATHLSYVVLGGTRPSKTTPSLAGSLCGTSTGLYFGFTLWIVGASLYISSVAATFSDIHLLYVPDMLIHSFIHPSIYPFIH